MNEAGARVVVGLTGATGAVYAIRLLQRLREAGRETHLVASSAGVLNVHHEIGLDRKGLEALADASYNPADVGAAMRAARSPTAGGARPCSMKLWQQVHRLPDNLLRAPATVTLKDSSGWS